MSYATPTNIDLIPCNRRSRCQNGGTCTNDGQGDYRCTCVAGYMGGACEMDVNECESEPCENGGTCRVSQVHTHTHLCNITQ